MMLFADLFHNKSDDLNKEIHSPMNKLKNKARFKYMIFFLLETFKQTQYYNKAVN